ncbi:unnamed protein product [Adineta ricciae]|uniref:MAM domain-containing protein n=1 Tax=Adineta ricciae TaxID=249248 RepID=A0A814RNI0_ADIRI|nr:unnamed protein product [Adineta ricciae]CAF1136328.1 unnamed protein product [Adineta ricciae]
MLFLLFIVVCNALLTETAIVRCDFETNCNDFTTGSNWGLTNGFNPQPIDHDHTLNNRSGHYIFYNSPSKCGMTNNDPFFPPTANFTVVTGETLPNKELGPNRDHTTNSTTGGFLYWVQRLPFTASDTGRMYTSI